MWQLCPKCKGLKVTDIEGDKTVPCNICNSTGLISEADGKPPKKDIKQASTFEHRVKEYGKPIFYSNEELEKEAKEELSKMLDRFYTVPELPKIRVYL